MFVRFGTNCRMRPLVFSFVPRSQGCAGLAKKTPSGINLASRSCCANSLPLSSVNVRRDFGGRLPNCSSILSMTVADFRFLTLFRISIPLSRSVVETSPLRLPGLTIVSPSQSPHRPRCSAITGRPAIDTVEGRCPRRSSFGLRFPRRRRKLSQCFRSLSRFIQRSIVLRETRFCFSNLSQTMRPAICSGDQYEIMPSRTFPLISMHDIFVGKGRVTLRNRVLSCAWTAEYSHPDELRRNSREMVLGLRPSAAAISLPEALENRI